MRSILITSRALIPAASLALLVSACGGGSAAAGSNTTPARTNDGQVVQTADGSAVSERAHNQWQDALTRFRQQETQGWNASSCDDIGGKFEAAADTQGGRFAEALYMAGLTHDRCGRGEQSLAFYNRALQANERYCQARVAVGLSQLAQGREAEAFTTFQRAIQANAQCTEGYVNLAILQRARGGDQVREALNNLRRALAIDAQYLPAFNQMALLYFEQATSDPQRLDLAEVVCSAATRINGNYAPIYNTWGLINDRQGNIIGALAKFERAFTLDNSIFEAHMNFGRITVKFRGYQDAKRAFERAVALRPRDYDAHIGLGIALRGLGQVQEAKAQYEAAREIDANRPEAYFNLGVLYQDYMQGEPAELQQALQYYDQFIARAGSNAAFADTVQDLRRQCAVQTGGSTRRRGRATCRPGRQQNIRTALEVGEQMRQLQQMQNQQQPAPAAPAPTPPTSAAPPPEAPPAS